MDQHNIDRLFREKMDGLEAVPSANSWSQVEKRLKSKRKPAYYWVAAAVTLIALSWTFTLYESNPETTIADLEITYPPAQMAKEFEIPVAAQLTKKQEVKSNVLIAAPRKAQVATVQNSTPKPPKAENMPTLEPKLETVLVADVTEKQPLDEITIDPVKDEPELARSTVKITYIASKENIDSFDAKSSNDSTSKFKRFIAFAEKIDPGEMLADIKTAKDNLLNGGLKNKKERGVMNP